ncbi:conserved hypothetical protein [Nitrosopumilaceae archaeon]|nr:hypothetical protein [Nitrosopumilus sp.]MDA7998161.1 hypothetical protein [Nitrosopumilus sp.]CAI9830947.1 conserved hypothetical protein [Nitrosopumilaceae archaeon]
MFIFDASALIAIFKEAGLPGLVAMLLKLDSDLVIPSNLWEHEILDPDTRGGLGRYVSEGSMRILVANTLEEIGKLRSEVSEPGAFVYGLGELDVILTYKKHFSDMAVVRCILDDEPARKLASRLGIRFTGLLDDLVDKGITDRDTIDRTRERLKEKGFRMRSVSKRGDPGRGV